MPIKSRKNYTYEDKQDNIFPIPWEVEDDSIKLYVSPDGLTAIMGSLTRDEACEDPFDTGCEGEFVQFNSRYVHSGCKPDIEDFKRLIRQSPGFVFTIGGNGSRYWIKAGPFNVADTKTTRECKTGTALDHADGYYIVPDDVTNPAEYAKIIMEEYSMWCEGECYGVRVWKYFRQSVNDSWGEPDRDNECWGYIGSEYAESELQSQFEYEVKRLPGIIATWFSGQWFYILRAARGGELSIERC